MAMAAAEENWSEWNSVYSGWRTRLPVKITGKPAEIAADQIRAISKSRLGRKLGSLSPRDAAALRRLLGEMYADS